MKTFYYILSAIFSAAGITLLVIGAFNPEGAWLIFLGLLVLTVGGIIFGITFRIHLNQYRTEARRAEYERQRNEALAAEEQRKQEEAEKKAREAELIKQVTLELKGKSPRDRIVELNRMKEEGRIDDGIFNKLRADALKYL